MNENTSPLRKKLHNLKSSITVISGYLQLLEQQIAKDPIDPIKVKELTTKAKSATQTMLEKIEKAEEEQD